MRKLRLKVSCKIKRACEMLSEKGKRRLLIILFVIYAICTTCMITQFFIAKKTQPEMKQVKVIEEQTIQTDSLFMGRPTSINNKKASN